MRRGGGLGPPTFNSGRGILGEMPRMFPGPGGFNQNNSILGGNMQRPNIPNNQNSGPRFGPMNNGTMGGLAKGDQQHIPSLMQQNMFMGKMAQQQQQQKQQMPQMPQMTAQQGFPNSTQNLRDTQLNFVNNLLKGAMSGGNGPQSGLLNNNGGNSNSILGSFPACPPGPGMKGTFMPQGQTSMPSGPLLPGFRQFNHNNNSPGIPSIFDINTNPSNRIAQRKRNPGFGSDHFEPAVKRTRPEQRQFPPGGTFIQNQAIEFDRPANRNDSFKRSASRLSVGRRDSSGSNQSERSQSSRGQNDRVRRTSKGDYDPANPTVGGPGSDSCSVHEETDGDFSVTINSKGRSVSDRKEERKGPAKSKKSPFFCHTCNVDCNDKDAFSEHMKSEFHQERMEGLLSLTQQKTNHLQARIAAEAHLRNIEGKGENQDRPTFCKTCNSSFTGALIQHRQSDQHKIKEKKDWSECTVCSQVFKSPQKFVRHMNTAHHKDNAEKQKESISGNGDSMETDSKGDVEELTPFDGETDNGEDFVLPVSGFYCKLCCRFYQRSNVTSAEHCRSRSHYNKYKDWQQEKKAGSCHGNGTVWEKSAAEEPDNNMLEDAIKAECDDQSDHGNSSSCERSPDAPQNDAGNQSDDPCEADQPEEISEETEIQLLSDQ